MILTKTPLRISIAGGGTDFPDYYLTHGGATLSFTIDKYIYVTVNHRWDDDIRLSYSKMEQVATIDKLQHELIREALRMVGINKAIEITTISDIPSTGSGMGSSSAVTVGVLKTLYLYNNICQPPDVLARQACEIEIDILGKPIGKQDQYGVAYEGMNHLRFLTDGTVNVEEISISPLCKRVLRDNLLLFYTGISRHSENILAKQTASISQNRAVLNKMHLQVEEMKDCIVSEDFKRIGEILHQGWTYKKQLAKSISIPLIDNLYQKALSAGATGGKVVGAGGGGFLLLYVPSKAIIDVRNVLSDYKELTFSYGEPQARTLAKARSNNDRISASTSS